ncbi:hypothetical protein [Sphingobacterium daejeonense]|uniref:hypothetical protein n=1 Tax=Sphingobacterium daejeonense TaxID=371142 RepID=UPI0010C45D35|nr:hypothetical protein [Sphingobacterium daejeonense]VTP86630.1 Uncharacterised protein [Sphingobacterium daejeonense]
MGKYRVSDVARMTGYKHSTHFTTAFKKYFWYYSQLIALYFSGGTRGSSGYP